MKITLLITLLVVAAYAFFRVVRAVGGLLGGNKSRPARGGLGGDTHQDDGDAGRPRRPHHGGF